MQNLISELEFLGMGSVSTYHNNKNEFVTIHLPHAVYTVKEHSNMFSLTGGDILIHELYLTVKEVANRLFDLHQKSYKPAKIENEKVWFFYPKYVENILSYEKKKIEVPPQDGFGEIGFDAVAVPIINFKAKPIDIALDYFPRRKIRGGYSMLSELNVYGCKVAKHTRLGLANAMIINPKLFYTINKRMDRDDPITDTCKGHFGNRYNWITFDESLPEDIIVVYMDSVTQPCQRAFAITNSGYAINPIIEHMGFILEIGDVSDHFVD